MDENSHKKPLISVIIPSYNAQAYIEEAITSVLEQTLGDFELLVIDDCSRDETRQIVASFEKRDKRVHLIENKENVGVARTRNRGLSLCKGQYVAFLDSDDYWKPEMLEKMVARAQESGADIVYCSYELVDEQGNRLCNDFIVPEKTDFESSIVRSVITCSSVLVNGKLAAKMRFPTQMYHEDIALWFALLKDGATAVGETEILASYRQHSDSRSAGKVVSALRRWPIYRKHLGMSVWKSAQAMVRYGYYGLRKFKRI